MGARSSILRLPAEVRAWIDSEFRRNGYSEIYRLERELAERGFKISNSALHRYSVGLRRLDGVPLRGGGLDLRPIWATDPKSPPPPPPPPSPAAATGDQRAAVKRWLASGRSINQRQAIEHFNCFRLAAVVHRIRVRDGWPVETRQCPNGFAEYHLPESFDPFRNHEVNSR